MGATPWSEYWGGPLSSSFLLLITFVTTIFYHKRVQCRSSKIILANFEKGELQRAAYHKMRGGSYEAFLVSSLVVILNMVSSGELDVILVSSGELCISRVGGGTPCQFWSVSQCNLGLGLCVRQSHA